MKQFRVLQPQFLKLSFFLSLLVILFLLLSFIFITPQNIALANIVQNINMFLSWPNSMLENLAHLSLHWTVTALCIQLFWFFTFYLVLLPLSFLQMNRCAGNICNHENQK